MNGRQHNPTNDRLTHLLGRAGPRTTRPAEPSALRRLAGTGRSGTGPGLSLTGARELVRAAQALGSRRPPPSAWTRMGGDAVDLTALGHALAARTRERRLRTTVVAAVAVAIAAGAVYTATRMSGRRERASEEAMNLHAAVTVKRPRDEVYRYWHDFTHLPRFMAHLESVETTGDGHSHWTARGPAKRSVEWDADIVEDDPGELIAWRSTGRTTVDNAGAVHFTDAPGDRGTELQVDLAYIPPAGRVGTTLAKVLGEHPEQQVRDDLRRFKQVMEAGEVVRSDASPEGTRALRQARQRPAQPMPAH